jgi:hypothetical protein
MWYRPTKKALVRGWIGYLSQEIKYEIKSIPQSCIQLEKPTRGHYID